MTTLNKLAKFNTVYYLITDPILERFEHYHNTGVRKHSNAQPQLCKFASAA